MGSQEKSSRRKRKKVSVAVFAPEGLADDVSKTSANKRNLHARKRYDLVEIVSKQNSAAHHDSVSKLIKSACLMKA